MDGTTEPVLAKLYRTYRCNILRHNFYAILLFHAIPEGWPVKMLVMKGIKLFDCGRIACMRITAFQLTLKLMHYIKTRL